MICTNPKCEYEGSACCAKCGFNADEDERRKNIPLTLCEDGLRRKLIGGGEREA